MSYPKTWQPLDFDWVLQILHRRTQKPRELNSAERVFFTPDLNAFDLAWLRFRTRLSDVEEKRLHEMLKTLVEQERKKAHALQISQAVRSSDDEKLKP